MKNILPLLASAMLFITPAVISSACAGTEHSEEVTAQITAAQMEGRSAARIFINREWNDTIGLQHHLLEAKSKQSKYIIDNKPECAAAFDSAFISTVRAVRPDLAKSIMRGR